LDSQADVVIIRTATLANYTKENFGE